MILLKGFQVRAARAILRLSVEELARRSGVSERSIRRVESAEQANVTTDVLGRLLRFFEAEGVSFSDNRDPRGAAVYFRELS